MASVTIEASLVMGMIFFSLMMLFRYAYELHDTVTGAMILEEAVEQIRFDQREDMDVSVYEAKGNAQGNPRLWLGEYEIGIQIDSSHVTGKASAGEWEQEIRMDVFRPGRFLRRMEALRGMTEESKNPGQEDAERD